MSSLVQILDTLAKRLDRIEHRDFSHYKGTSAIDFTLITLPHQGDYGYQTTDGELQMNCNGAIRATAMAAV